MSQQCSNIRGVFVLHSQMPYLSIYLVIWSLGPTSVVGAREMILRFGLYNRQINDTMHIVSTSVPILLL